MAVRHEAAGVHMAEGLYKTTGRRCCTSAQALPTGWRTYTTRARGRPFGHTTVAVRRAGHHTLEKSEHSAHLRHRIEACHEVHLRGTRVGEADIHAAANQCADKGQCTIHGIGLGSVI